MATSNSFDVTTGCDLQEVDNAINQAVKEIGQRYDFKNVKFKLEFDRPKNLLLLEAPESSKLDAVWDVVQSKLLRRGVPIQNMKRGDAVTAAGGTLRQEIVIAQGIESDTAKKIVKYLKESKLKKVQASIQGEQVRVAGASRDDLQEAMQLLKSQDFGVALNFGNYR